MKRHVTSLAAAGTAALLAVTSAKASTPGPTDQIKAVFAKTNTGSLCVGTTLQTGALIGEIATAYKLNVFTLPSIPEDAGIAAPDTVEGRTAAWLVYRKRSDFKDTVLKAGQADLLDEIGTDLTDYTVWLGANGKQPFSLAQAASIPAIYDAPAERRSGMRAELLKRLLAQFLTGADPRPVLQCANPAASTGGSSDAGPGKDSGGDGKSKITLAVRGKIEDLAIPSKGSGSDKFKGASSASFAFTDNHQKGETSVAIDGTIAAGYQNGRIESLLAFVRYTQNSTETSKAGDDDDSKDVRALSPGIVYARAASIGKAIYGTAGLTAYPTFDFAQHARTGRVRLFLDDITLRGLTKAPLCGGSDRIGGLELSCLAGVFVEGAHVWRAGNSTDLASIEDDQYLGLGTSLRLGLSLPIITVLKPFLLTGEYRYMSVISGSLADPHRLSLALNYKLAEQNLTFGIGYDTGSNFDTFQRERLTKVNFGFKY